MSDCCKRPKNPCMVCKRTVTPKTGLQCQGSCKSWIHFTCCSYTPGKIKDIKAKIIKVRCPCPDCSTEGPKEVIVKDSSFTCVNKICPTKIPPKCPKHACPMNRLNQQTSTCNESKPPEWPGVPCGTSSCKKNSRDDEMGDRCLPPPCPPPPCQPPPCSQPQPCPPPPCPQGQGSPYSPRPSPPSPYPTSPMCPTPPQRSPPSTPVMPSISIVENMCETVGLLSDQLNQLMCKMTDVLAPKGNSNPCRCPQNPRR